MVLGKEVVADMSKGKEIVTSGSMTTTDHADEAMKDNSSTTVQTEEISKSTADHDDKRKFYVLIVDDCSFNNIRLLHSYVVTHLGLEAHLAENGKEAVDLHRSGACFDLILMDMSMPLMDGVQATKELQGMGVDTMIVGVTANDGREQQVFVEAGLNDCYSKPLTVGKLAALLQVIKETNDKNI